MKRRFSTYLTCALIIVGFMACGGDSDDDVDKQPTQPSTSGGGDALQIDVKPAESGDNRGFYPTREAIEQRCQPFSLWLRIAKAKMSVAWVLGGAGARKPAGKQ